MLITGGQSGPSRGAGTRRHGRATDADLTRQRGARQTTEWHTATARQPRGRANNYRPDRPQNYAPRDAGNGQADSRLRWALLYSDKRPTMRLSELQRNTNETVLLSARVIPVAQL